MNLARAGAATLLLGALVLMFSPAAFAKPARASAQSFNRALLQTAGQLEAAAKAARHTPRHAGTIPALRLPPAPLEFLPSRGPSLDRWLQFQLRQIRAQRSGKIQARELADLAISLRRVAQPGRAWAPVLDPHAQTVAILAQRAYQTGGAGPAPAPHETLIQTFLRWLARKLGELVSRIFGATASKPIIGQIVAVLYVSLVAAVAIYLIAVLVSLLIRRRRPSRLDEGTPLQERMQPDALYDLGMAAASEGRYAQAVSLLFQASLASFDAAGKLPYDGSLTAGEYRRAVRRTLAAASPYFDDIARAFVIAAFAERPISKDEFSAADAAYRCLRPLVAS